jgi:hypothetical protein
LALGWSFTRKNFRKSIQWGLIPKNASQKWTKTDTWRMPLGFKLSYSIP